MLNDSSTLFKIIYIVPFHAIMLAQQTLQMHLCLHSDSNDFGKMTVSRTHSVESDESRLT